MTEAARKLPWLADAEDRAMSWIITNQLPDYLAEVQPRRSAELAKARSLVVKRLEGERDRLLLDAAIAAEKERAGEKPKESAESLNRKAVELDIRLRQRLELLDQQALMSTKPPHIVTAALVLPIGMLEGELPASAPIHAKETKEVERRGVDLVLARERELGRKPVEQAFNNKGFDILSTDSQRRHLPHRGQGPHRRRHRLLRHPQRGDDRQERRPALPPRPRPGRLRGAQHDEVRYLDDPFATTDLGDFEATGIRGDWAKMWAKEGLPSDVRAPRGRAANCRYTAARGTASEITCDQCSETGYPPRATPGVPRRPTARIMDLKRRMR